MLHEIFCMNSFCLCTCICLFLLAVLFLFYYKVVLKCVIRGCYSQYGIGISFYSFPKDPSLAASWYRNLKNGLPANFHLNTILPSHKVCSRHFLESDLHQTGKGPRLNHNVVPGYIKVDEVPPENPSTPETPAQLIIKLRRRIAKLQFQIKNPSSSYIKNHRHKLKNFISENAYIMLESAINNHLRKPSGRRHSYASKKLTSLILHKSPKAYRIIQPIFSLPSLRTIDRHIKDSFSETGISSSTVSLLKKHASFIEENDKICILSFDETEIKPSFNYLPRRDIVDGFVDMANNGRSDKKATSVLVFGLRGIAEKWKQVICYYFAGKDTLRGIGLKNILFDVLEVVFNCGYKVTAIVCDGDGKNRGLFNILETDHTSTFSFNDHRIHFIYDVPHIFKLIRNNLITKQLHVNFNENLTGFINWNDILKHLEPIAKQNSLASGTSTRIISECPKITSKHLHPNNYEKMRVRLATQLFSHTVSSSFLCAANRSDCSSSYILIGTFFRELDRIFDILNSSTLSYSDGKMWKTVLKYNDGNFKTLINFKERIDNNSIYFTTSRSSTQKTNTVYCLKMLSSSIAAITSLSKTVTDLGLPYLATKRCNQDILENFFAQIRSSSQILNTSHFRSQFRASRIIFMDKLSCETNCEQDDDFPLFLTDIDDSLSTHSSNSQLSSADELAEYFKNFNPDLVNEPYSSSQLSSFFSTFTPDDVGEDSTILCQQQLEEASHRGLISYIAGYIINRIKKSKIHCTNCINHVIASSTLPDHDLIACRVFADNRPITLHLPSSISSLPSTSSSFNLPLTSASAIQSSVNIPSTSCNSSELSLPTSLHFPSSEFTNFILSLTDILEKNIPNLIAIIGIKFSLFKLLWRQSCDFIPICHRDSIKLHCIHLLINMYVGKYIKNMRHSISDEKPRKVMQQSSLRP